MSDKKKAATLASVAVAGLIVAGGATAALNANAETTTGNNGSSYGAPAGYGQQGKGTRTGQNQAGEQGGQQDGRGGHRRMQGTEVTGSELTKVTEALKAKDSAFTVEHVMKDSDGNYHVMGTKSGNRAGYEVSKDLKTITAHTMGGRGGKGGPGGHSHTAATADETAKVKAAVKAKDSAVTVESVQKDPDGSFDVMGTKSGNRVMVEVSKDLKTIEVRTGGPGQR